MQNYLPDGVYIGAQVGPATVHLGEEVVQRYKRVIGSESDEWSSDPFCPPTILESFLSRLVVEAFHYLEYGRLHMRTSLHYVRPIPIGSTVTMTGQLVDIYEKGDNDYLVIQFQVTDADRGRLLDAEVHHLIKYRGGDVEYR